ncbi:MAG: MarC family protein [Acidilobaceae archaeon]
MVDWLVEIGKPILMLFIAIDPIGTIPYYQALIGRVEYGSRKRVLRQSVIVASILLILFIIVGDAILKLFNITLYDFKVAAGIVLLIASIALLLDIQLGSIKTGSETIAIVPLATPLLAGPAAISIAIFIKYSWGLPIALLTILVDSLITYIILASSNTIFNLIGRNGLLVIDKFMSLIMAALAVSLIKGGLGV